MKKVILFIILSPLLLFSQDFSVGSWRDHLPYSNVEYVVPINNKCYASTPYSLYYYDLEDNSVNRLTTINGLSELGVSIIHPNHQNNALVVGYNSGNIDIVKGDQIINISAIVNSSVIGDRKIYGMYSKDNFTYLATGFGIVVLDVNKEEIKDTYYIGNNGEQIKVNDITIGGGYIYAATDLGVIFASENTPFLANPASWSELIVPLTSATNFELIEYINGASSERLVVIQKGSSLNDDVGFCYENNSWNSPAELNSDEINSIELNASNLVVSKNGSVIEYDWTFNDLESLFTFSGVSNVAPNHAVWDGSKYWIGDRKLGLIALESNWKANQYPISGPYSNEGVHLVCLENELWVSAGRTTGSNWNNTYNWRGCFHFNQFDWEAVNRTSISELADSVDLVSDFIWTTIDPSNTEHVFLSSFRGGLVEVLSGEMIKRHTYYNSSLQTRINQGGENVFVSGTCFDNEGNLWVCNSFVSEPLSMLTPEGEWMSFTCGSSASDKLCTDLYIDKTMGYIWMSIKDVGIVVYDNNQTPLISSDDQYKVLNSNTGQGGLPNNVVNTITEDRDGEIWIGTEQGPAVIYNVYDIFSSNDIDAQQILLNLDGSVQLLLENENISEILIDGGNRKWLASAGGGLFLMSEDGTEMIYSFNKDNSPLFSNSISSLAMNENTGELYIATAEGLMGFKAEATSPETQFSDIYAYPNPVRPEYRGNIAVKGFMEKSEVKITDASGNLVYSTVSIGGQAIWSGNTLDGNRVKSGVYYVFATSQDGTQKTKTKILVLN